MKSLEVVVGDVDDNLLETFDEEANEVIDAVELMLWRLLHMKYPRWHNMI